VFPVRPKSKIPATENGLLAATIDVDRISRYWAGHPEHNVGIRCGVPSRIVVLDVDGDNGTESLRALEREYGDLPETTSIVTPRGGQHYYFAHPLVGEVRNTQGVPGVGLDVRGDGGYVLAPPSGVGERTYEMDNDAPLAILPDWLHRLLVLQQTRLGGVSRDYADMVRIGAREGERNSDLLKLIGHLWNRVGAGEVLEIALAVNDARCRPPLREREVKKIVDSVQRMRSRDQLALVS
jgi:hypothetical protein